MAAPGDRTNRRAGPRWRAMLASLVLAPAMLVGCATGEEGPGGASVLAPSMRAIALARHHVDLALGRHARNLGAGAEILPGAAASVGRACSGSRPSVTWLGHSSALIHIGGRCLLTDPVLEANRSVASPLPQRLVEIPLRVEDLPEIDAIILSHGDFDHLHMPTLRALIRRFPDVEVLVPPGSAGPVALGRLPQVIQSRLGQALHRHGLTITAERAHHGTRRNLAALRTGEAFSWVVTDGRTRILFIGDTAYGPAFKEIFGRHGAIDLLLVPIGAHEP
ncbi:MAG: MBL fold metallo-hydrolase, partial [Hoeflea sp.]|nr:MBL fold metallo-hydrolase [Hoeflea sp.]